MIIASSNVMMTAENSYKKKEISASVSTSQTVGFFMQTNQQALSATNGVSGDLQINRASDMAKLRMAVIERLLTWIFGSEEAQEYTESLANSYGVYQQQTTETYYYLEEDQQMDYETQGTVVTSDGREITFDLQVSMSDSFKKEVYEKTSRTVPVMLDPLVINMDYDGAMIADQKFSFDLDCDGEQEMLHMLSGGSGFLALDKNMDDIINDGSELFGTASGDGFRDLSAYDLDGNGWIDEADAVFDKLQIWIPDEEGNGTCYKLKERGVGAICLQNVGTNYNKRDTSGDLAASIRKTGMFLYENGKAGTIQHVDMAM